MHDVDTNTSLGNQLSWSIQANIDSLIDEIFIVMSTVFPLAGLFREA